ncbi:MAG: hypothetical protein C3F16_14895, partial [Betaproteobacteria bacterium]
MNRREFLGMAVAGAGSLLPGCGGGSSGVPVMGGPLPPGGAALAQGLPLKSLATLANATPEAGRFSAALVAAPADLSLLQGRTTSLWLYNGLLPGPVVDVREGDHVRIALENRLPLDTTVHWHGLPVPAEQDGSPMDPVRPGATRIYEFDLPP